MSHALISLSPDLQRLVDDGFDIEIIAGHLVMNNVPYVGADRTIRRGRLFAALSLAGDRTLRPGTHVAFFEGNMPCDANGREMLEMRLSSSPQNLGSGLIANHSFSRKPREGYADYYQMFTVYLGLISGPARQIDATASAFEPKQEAA